MSSTQLTFSFAALAIAEAITTSCPTQPIFTCMVRPVLLVFVFLGQARLIEIDFVRWVGSLGVRMNLESPWELFGFCQQ